MDNKYKQNLATLYKGCKKFVDDAIELSKFNLYYDWEKVYDAIFDLYKNARLNWGFHLDYYDPDKDYEDDVMAFFNALKSKAFEDLGENESDWDNNVTENNIVDIPKTFVSKYCEMVVDSLDDQNIIHKKYGEILPNNVVKKVGSDEVCIGFIHIGRWHSTEEDIVTFCQNICENFDDNVKEAFQRMQSSIRK